jgi:hypothetical protein
MRKLPIICLALAASIACSPAFAQLFRFSERSENKGRPVVTECAETERRPHSSVIMYRVKGAGSVGSSLFHVYCMYQVAKLRGMRYAVILRDGGNDDGSWETELGLTNSPATDLPALFGRPAAGPDLIDTRDFAPMFDGR